MQKTIYKDDRGLEKYTMPFGVLLPVALSYIVFSMAAGTLGLVVGSVFLYFGLIRTIYAWLSISNAPILIEIDGHQLKAQMIYGKEIQIQLSQITHAIHSPWLMVLTLDFSIILRTSAGRRFLFSTSFNGFREMFTSLKMKNPQIQLSGRYFRDF